MVKHLQPVGGSDGKQLRVSCGTSSELKLQAGPRSNNSLLYLAVVGQDSGRYLQLGLPHLYIGQAWLHGQSNSHHLAAAAVLASIVSQCLGVRRVQRDTLGGLLPIRLLYLHRQGNQRDMATCQVLPAKLRLRVTSQPPA